MKMKKYPDIKKKKKTHNEQRTQNYHQKSPIFFSKKSFQNDSYQYSSSQTKPINKLIPSSN